jgi:hypothetical protein
LAGIEVAAKEIERVSEDLRAHAGVFLDTQTEREYDRVKEPIKIMYAPMHGTGVPVVKKEAVGREGKEKVESQRLER